MSTPPTGLVHSPLFLKHETGPGHPERKERLIEVRKRLEASGLLSAVELAEPEPAPRAALEGVHDADYLDRAERMVRGGVSTLDAGDTAVSTDSWDAAVAASGGLMLACERVLRAEWSNAFVLCRPPGHHAERAVAMGFCLINHVAVAARHLRNAHGLERVAILDWDVHHGNGTQHLFEDDPSVLYASLHQYPHYPGTGARGERGRGAGEGATLNCPMSAGTGDADWLGAIEGEVLPRLEEFAPDFVLISAGFDAHRADPLSGTLVTEAGYAEMTRLLRGFAAERCGGRLVSVLEGGYDLAALATSVEAHVAGLVEA